MPYRRGAMESNSSKNRTHGLAALARSNSSRTYVKMSFDRFHIGFTHRFLACTDILIQQLRSLNPDEVQSTLLGYS